MKKHILVVDDEADIRDLLMQILEHSGYRVSAVATAIEALRLAAKDPPQLIISDLQLEDSDGLDMIELLKAMLPNTPMMLLTGVFFDPKVVRDPWCCASPTAPRTAAPTPTMRAWRCRRTANTW